MLATLAGEPFQKPGWVYEEKYDGFRILAYKEGDRVSLVSRNGIDRSGSYPGVSAAVGKLSPRTLVLDGEVVAFDRHHVSRFQLLQNGSVEPQYAVFDCLYRDGRDLRTETLARRRSELEEIIGAKRGKIFLSARLADDGLKAYREAKHRGLEGVLAKDDSAPYVEGRSSRWLKFKVHQEDEFVIVGYTAPAGSREHFGALLVAAYNAGKLRYAGKVGTGFSREVLGQLYKNFRPLVRATPAIVDPPREKNVTYLEPNLVAQISYAELTDDLKLRQPVFLGLRDDKRAEEVEFPLVHHSLAKRSGAEDR